MLLLITDTPKRAPCGSWPGEGFDTWLVESGRLAVPGYPHVQEGLRTALVKTAPCTTLRPRIGKQGDRWCPSPPVTKRRVQMI